MYQPLIDCMPESASGGVHGPGGVPGPGRYLLQGDVCWQGGPGPGGGAGPGGPGRGGWYPSMHWGRPSPPREQNDRQVQKYYKIQCVCFLFSYLFCQCIWLMMLFNAPSHVDVIRSIWKLYSLLNISISQFSEKQLNLKLSPNEAIVYSI